MKMTNEEIAAFVDELYAASGAGDWQRTSDMLTEDFVAVEAQGLPMAGEYRGKDGLRDLYAKVMAMVDVASLDRSALTVGDNCAVAVLTMRFADDTLAPAELCELFRFRDGKCCEIKPFYFDQAPFNAAFRTRLQSVKVS